MFLIFVLIVLRNIEVKSLNIIKADPPNTQVNLKRLEQIPFILMFDMDLCNSSENDYRNQTIIVLSNSEHHHTVNYSAVDKQDDEVKNKIKYILDHKDFTDKYGKYDLTFYQNGLAQPLQFKEKILIYNNELKLKNPKKKYRLTTSEIVNVQYEFQDKVFKDEIYKIEYYQEGQNKRTTLNENDYTLDKDGFNLTIKFNGNTSVSTYVFEMFPEYNKDIINEDYHIFYLYFHNYLLKNDAIYLNKDNYTNNIVSFKTLLKKQHEKNPFKISDNNIQFISFNCSEESSLYKCDNVIDLGYRISPGKITITYEENQLRDLFYILYSSNMKKCYEKDDEDENMNITMEWSSEMEYQHYLYFSEEPPMPLVPTSLKQTKYIYSKSTKSLSSGLFYLYSSIPSLNYTDFYNLVDEEHLSIMMVPNAKIIDEQVSYIFSHDDREQIVNITFDNSKGLETLEGIILRKNDSSKEINVSSSKHQCIPDKSNLICDLKEIIYNYEEKENGCYFVYYKSKCGKEKLIEGRTVILDTGYSLKSINPPWINLSYVNTTVLKLEYDGDMEKKTNKFFCLYKTPFKCIYNYSSSSSFRVDKNIVYINLGNIGKGFYYVFTKIDRFEFGSNNLGFKVSEPIKFIFNHHYFVLNDENKKNMLKITVGENSEEFGNKIIENKDKYVLTNESSLVYDYPIKQSGKFEFSYYDIDNVTIPINDSITVVRVYTNYFSFISLKDCYYFDFDITVNIQNIYKNNLTLFLFLKSEDDSISFNLTNVTNKFLLENNNNSSIFEKKFNLYVSENYYDPDVYLSKSSKITFTEIKVPEFIINPNRTIIFTDVKCDLSKSSFVIKKAEGNEISRILNNCNYYNNTNIECNIAGIFYLNDQYRYYFYQIDNKNITNFNDKNVYYTFVSKKLNEASFSVTHDHNGIDYTFIIENKEKDFYLNLLKELAVNNNNNKISYTEDKDKDKFKIYKESGIIELNETIEINSMFYLDYLERNRYIRENNIDNITFYYFFDYKINNRLFEVNPTIFAYNEIDENTNFMITITFYNEKLIDKYNIYTNLKDCPATLAPNKNNKCIDIKKDDFSQGPIDLPISIGDGTNSGTSTIHFINYKLSDQSKECITKNDNMDDIMFIIKFSNSSLINKLEIYSDIRIISNETNMISKQINYMLASKEIDFQETYIQIYIEEENFFHQLKLEDIGLNILPKYNISLNNDNNENSLYLLEGESQEVKVFISTENNIHINSEDITGFKIKKEKMEDVKIKDNDQQSFNLIFDNVESNINNSKLFYVDRCGKDIVTNIKIYVQSLKLERHYYIINNKYNNKQYLKIKGQYLNNINITVHKNGAYFEIMKYNSQYNYYIELDENSLGDYTFFVNNNNLNTQIEGIVYVRENLEDLLKIDKRPQSCIFFNNDKNSLTSLTFNISSKNELIKDISIFKSSFTINKERFYDFSNSSDSKKQYFEYKYSNEVKEKIKLNQEYYIFLTEKDDKEQPIYVYKIYYTNIYLNPLFSEVIHTDAIYLLFNMSCKIDDLQPFYLSSSSNGGNEEHKIECQENSNSYDVSEKLYKCFLSPDQEDKNAFYKIKKRIFKYYNYHLKYSSFTITNKTFNLSHEIIDVDFNVIIDEVNDIVPDSDTEITIVNRIDKKFYFPCTKNVSYIITTNPSVFYETSITKKDINIICQINVKSQNVYRIRRICREKCDYCRYEDCKLIDSEDIKTTYPIVTFKFSQHYIALKNTKKENDNKLVDSLEIIIDGDPNQISKIDQLYFYYTKDNKSFQKDIINYNGNKYILPGLQYGKYIFEYSVKNRNKSVPLKNDDVLVVNYDYEMFNFTELNSKCLYYKKQKGMLVSITKNDSYLFKNDVLESKMDIVLNGKEFRFDTDNGYKYTQSGEEEYIGKEFPLEFKEYNTEYIFTTILEKVTITTFNLENVDYFYKDNIVLEKQSCSLDNIYIIPESNKKDHILLKCDYYEEKKLSICDAKDYQFETKREYFDICIGNKNYFSTDFQQLIYNSIKDSEFTLDFDQSIISITSPNFDLSHIAQMKIDDDPKDVFPVKESDLLKYPFNYDSNVENFITEFVRRDHDLDQEGITIKNKTVNIKIEKTKCPDFLVRKRGFCVSCEANEALEKDGKKWYQNGECVSKCEAPYYILSIEHYYCYNCIEKTFDQNNVGYCGCLQGTVKLDTDGNCYLPEDDRVKNYLLIRPNMQCYRPNSETHNYCNNTHTERCELKSYSGYSFPYCICSKGYSGKYCEFRDGNPELNKNMDTILKGKIDDKINENSPIVVAAIRSTIFYLEKDGDKYMPEIGTNYIDSYIDATINCIDIAKKNNSTSPQIYDVIELAIYFLYYNINKKRYRMRNLQENKIKLKTIIEDAHYMNYLSNKNKTFNYNFFTDGLNLVSFISYKKSAIDEGFKKYIKDITSSSDIIGYIDLKNNNVKPNELIILTIINKKLLLINNESGVVFNFTTQNQNINLRDLSDFNVYVYSYDIHVNYALAIYYQSKNISIYDKNDKCFTEPCFISESFQYDLTQEYRKKHVFQKWAVNNVQCRFNSFEAASNNIDLFCQKFENFSSGPQENPINYAFLTLNMKTDNIEDQDKVYNLPMKCPKKIYSLESNIAFWIYLIICLLEIIYIIGINILTLGSLRKVSIRKGLVNDQIYYKIPRISDEEKDDDDSNDTSIKKKSPYKYKEKEGKPQKKSIENSENEFIESEITFSKTLPDCILSNFKELHPLASLCRVSIISPLILHSWFFTFNLLTLFGFNALIYYEGLIEKRIYDKKRNYFDYPMRKEFHKIILSILCQVALTAIIKFIVLVFLKQRDNLEASLKNCKLKVREEVNNDIVARIDKFENEMLIRRLIGGFIMLVIVTFFFYYTVVFCGIYINTQKNWIYGCVWSLFWNWVIFAPIYIVVISVLEHKKQDSYNPLVYNLKRLFVF